MGIAQLVRVLDCGSRGRGFDSHYPPHISLAGLPVIVGVSPSGKARDFDSRIRRFKSCYPSHYDPLAQSAEHLTFNQGVPSSNLGWITNISAGVAELADALDLGSSV